MQNLLDKKEQFNMVNENLILSLAGIYYMTIFKVLHKFKSLQGRGALNRWRLKHYGENNHLKDSTDLLADIRYLKKNS